MSKKDKNKEQLIENQEVDTEKVNTEASETSNEETSSANDQENKIAELEEKCADLADKNLRMMAEFDNYRRRTNKEKLEMKQVAAEGIMKDMLPLIDDFERAIEAMHKTEDIASLREGIELIYNKFITYLDKNDVHAIDTKDAKFDTDLHEAITTFPAPTEEQKGMVIDCTQKGYKLGEKVIRFAKVVVGE